MCRWRPYEHIHAKYDTHPDLVDLYAVPPSEEKTKWPFNSMMRTKLIWDILHSRVEDGGCGLDINSLTFHDDILAFLTLHDAAERNALYAAFIQQFINEKIIEKIADVDSAEALDEAAEVDYVVNDKDDGPYYRDISFYRDDDHISSFMQSMELLEKEGEKLENFEKLEVEKLETTFSKNKPKTDTV